MYEDHGVHPKDIIGEIPKDRPGACEEARCNVCQELTDLDKEIQTMENLLRIRKQKRLTLKALKNDFHSPLIKKLPYEIISHIFSLVHRSIDYFSLDRHTFPLGYFCAPVLLSSVCHCLREIALSMPELWTNVYINVYRQPDQLTEEWLNRVRPLPLNLTLYRKEDPKLSRFSKTPLFKLLRSHSARWCFLNLKPGGGLSLYRLFERLEPLPKWDSLHIRLGMANDQYSINLPAASLQPRQFYSLDHEWIDGKRIWGWDNLTSLELLDHPTDTVLEVIEKAPRLKHCVLYNISPPYSHKKVNTVVNEALEDLTLSFDSYDAFFLQILALPSLQHLRYDMPGNISSTNPRLFHDLWNFFIRSEIRSTSLKTFNLGYHAASWPNSDHTEFWEIIAALTHLSIEMKPGSNTLDSLLLQGSDITIPARLQELRLQVGESYYTNPSMGIGTWDALCDFVTELNFNAGLDLENQTSSSYALGQNLPKKTPITNSSIIDEQRRWSLNLISIVLEKRPSTKAIYIKIKKDTLLRLQQAQKAGPVTLTVGTESSKQDGLQGSLSWQDIDNDVVLWKILN